MNKKAQIISLFWAGILIFIVAVATFISLIFISSSFGSREKIAEQAFETDFFGPVIPVLIRSDYSVVEMLDNLINNPNQESEIYDYFRNVLESYGFESLRINIVQVLGDDTYAISDGSYRETFYYIYEPSKYLKLDLVINFE